MPNRVSTAQIFNNSHAHIAKAREKEVTSAEKAATFKEINRPSQNAIGFITSSRLKDDLSLRETLTKNGGLANQILSTTDTALSQVQEYVQRAKELALGAAGKDAHSDGARAYIFKDASDLYDSLIQAVNARFADRTLFGGLKTETPAFEHSGKYLGDSGRMEIEIDRKLRIPINVPGTHAIMGEHLRDGVNILEVFQRMLDGMKHDDHETIRGTLEDLDKANSQISTVRAEVGSLMTQLDRAKNAHGEITMEEKIAISKVEEADAIKTFSDLARDQAVLQASILSTQKILSQNPVEELYK